MAPATLIMRYYLIFFALIIFCYSHIMKQKRERNEAYALDMVSR